MDLPINLRTIGGPILPGMHWLTSTMVFLTLCILLMIPWSAKAIDVQVQDGQGAINVQEQGGQVAEEPQELWDLPGITNEDITLFDPDSIPDSMPLPDSTWVFQVPIEVSDLPAEVQRIGIMCNVFETVHASSGWVAINSCGQAKARIDVVNGAVSQTVIIGVQGAWDRTVSSGYAAPWEAEKWECKMYLIGPDNHWNIPSTDVVNPQWRRADPGEAFQWHAGPHPLPDEAKVPNPNE